MANAKHLATLRQGVKAWNAWRKEEGWVRPDLSEAPLFQARLSGANLIEVELSWAKLNEADLSEACLHGANLYGANLRAAELGKANLSGAKLNEADLSGAYLWRADLSGARLLLANLRQADLHEACLRGANLYGANLIDAKLNGADLTGAKLWEIQRGGWSIKNVICQVAFWDRNSREPTKYEEGEFERIFAEKPHIVLHYPGGMKPIDLVALPLIVERLQAEHPRSVLQVRSVQNDAGGALVTITVDDRSGRRPKALERELVRIQTKMEQAFEERDYLRRLVKDALTKIVESPRQEIHYHHPRGRIEGPTSMSRDTYNIKLAGAVGPGAQACNNTFQQIQGGTDLPKLAEELGRLGAAMRGETGGTREQNKAIGAVADAEEAAAKGDGPAALQYLKSAGQWTLGIAEKIGVPVAIEVLKRAM